MLLISLKFIKVSYLNKNRSTTKLKYQNDFLSYMTQKPLKKDSASIFVASMLQSAQENKEVKPQTRYDNVDQEQIDQVMANIKKGLARKS